MRSNDLFLVETLNNCIENKEKAIKLYQEQMERKLNEIEEIKKDYLIKIKNAKIKTDQEIKEIENQLQLKFQDESKSFIFFSIHFIVELLKQSIEESGSKNAEYEKALALKKQKIEELEAHYINIIQQIHNIQNMLDFQFKLYCKFVLNSIF